jgi:hypothetical protein
MTTPNSFAPEVIADSSGKWCGNGLRFATENEAQHYVRDLSLRWLLVRETRVVPSEDPVSDYWDQEEGRSRPLPVPPSAA